MVEIDKRHTIRLEEATSLFRPRASNIRNHTIKTDNHITKYFCRFLKNSFVVRVSDIIFFCCRSTITDAYFFAQIDYFSFFWNVGFDNLLFVVPREFPWLYEVCVCELYPTIKGELPLEKPVHFFIWYDICDTLLTVFIFFLYERRESVFVITCYERLCS